MFTEQDIINMYVNDKMSITKINQLTSDYNYRQIQKILVNNGITIRGGRKKKTFSEEQLKLIKEKFFEEKIPIKEIAGLVNVDVETLTNYIKEQKWIRTSNRVNKFLIEDYFENIDCPEKAYWLGILLTDGSVDKKDNNHQGRIRLQLQLEDKELVEKFKQTLNVSSELILDNRGKGCISCEFVSQKMFDDLSKYGIIPQKTYKLEHLPTNIPKEYMVDFIRGLYDGDGGLTYSADLTSDVTFNFTTYHESIAKEYQKFVDELIKKENHNKIIYTTAWHVHWRGYNQVIQILDILYKNATIYLNRKYKKYLVLKNRNQKN